MHLSRWRRLLGAALLVLAALGPAKAQAVDCAVRQDFANPDMLASMRRGVNLSTWNRNEGGPKLAQLQALREDGFTHIRLPVDNALLTGNESAAYLDELFGEVVFLLSLDYTVSIDLHPDGEVGELFRQNPAEAEAYLADLWTAIARRVRSFDPRKVAVELLNEPEVDQATWHAAAGRLVRVIRPLLPDTTIVAGPSGPQRHETLADMEPFDDRNVVYAVHYYDPFAFTHQGADWDGSGEQLRYLKDLPFPATADSAEMKVRIATLMRSGHMEAANVLARSLETPWSEAEIASAFDVMQRWSAANGRPVIVNEFGVLAHVAPRRSRLDWLSIVRRQAESRCIGWVHWDFQDGFGIIDPATEMPDAGVVEALIPAGD